MHVRLSLLAGHYRDSPFTKTSSPVHSENSFNKTPNDKSDLKKAPFAAPKNLFDVRMYVDT